ncbi:MAG: NAD-dependent epimerase/dehydratase family protein [Myxococcales bacterium]|nr:NAD-dependent epimerase/dehydratase family protein [Myxococcales bacterium]
MIVALTGATGLLGANVAEACLAAGHSVRATHRSTSRRDHLADLDIEWRCAPLGDPLALTEAFEGCDAVIHCAALTSLLAHPTPALVAANVTGTANVIDAARRAGISKLLHTSSTVAVGVSETSEPCDEDSDWNLVARGLADGYAITKRDSEQLALQAADDTLDVVVVNPGFLFGPRDARPSSGAMILEVARGRAVASTPGRNSFVDVRDVAAGTLAALTRGRSGERYILAGENCSYLEMMGRIARVVGASPPRFTAPRGLATALGWIGDGVERLTGREQAITTQTVRWGFEPGFVFHSDKARRELGYTTRPVEDGIRAAWAWFEDREGRAADAGAPM